MVSQSNLKGLMIELNDFIEANIINIQKYKNYCNDFSEKFTTDSKYTSKILDNFSSTKEQIYYEIELNNKLAEKLKLILSERITNDPFFNNYDYLEIKISNIKNIQHSTYSLFQDFTQSTDQFDQKLLNEHINNLEKKIIKDRFEDYLDHIYDINKAIHRRYLEINNILNETTNEIIKISQENSKISDNQFRIRFEEETSIIIKRYESALTKLTVQFQNEIKVFKLEQEEIKTSSDLVRKNIDSSLKDLTQLNNKVQEVELEFSKNISSETDKIRTELETSKIKISDQIDTIINHVKVKSQAIETAHSDFVVLVEKAGIYELTKNYKEKSDEEKIEYKKYRNYTSWSIIAAIISTIGVFAFAFWEQSQIPTGKVVDTNYLLLVSRLSISLMFFVLALYLSKQASKHYECYQENHRTFLQLAALEPFMARMTPEEQKEIRKGLIPSYFNQSNEGKYASKGDEVDLSSNMTAIVNSLIEKIPSKKESESSNKPEGTAG